MVSFGCFCCICLLGNTKCETVQLRANKAHHQVQPSVQPTRRKERGRMIHSPNGISTYNSTTPTGRSRMYTGGPLFNGKQTSNGKAKEWIY